MGGPGGPGGDALGISTFLYLPTTSCGNFVPVSVGAVILGVGNLLIRLAAALAEPPEPPDSSELFLVLFSGEKSLCLDLLLLVAWDGSDFGKEGKFMLDLKA